MSVNIDSVKYYDQLSPDVDVIGHYSQAVELPNGMIYLAGQKAWKPGQGTKVVGTIEEQTTQALGNIGKILEGLALGIKNIVRIQCFLANPDDYQSFNTAYAKALGKHKPARFVINGIGLRGGALIELVADAYRP